MPVSPSAEDNLIHGLSDFWVAFFRDSDRLRSIYEAQAVQYGQLYLDLMDAVLGVSLDHVPLFSKRYFKDFYIREDELIFSEGASEADDRWLHVSEDKLSGVAWLMNRVVSPTSVVEPGRDYTIMEGAIAFTVNPFSADAYRNFAVKTLDIEYPVAATGTWTGVRVGDTARFTPVGGRPVYARVKGVRENKLLLDRYATEFSSSAGGVLSVLRTPFDSVKAGMPITPQPVEVSSVTVTPVTASRRLNVTGADSSWVGTYIALQDATVPGNSGFHRVNSAGAGYVLVDSVGLFLESPAQSAHRVAFAEDLGAHPVAQLSHTDLRDATLTVYGRSVDGSGLEEGVDFVANSKDGTLRFLSAWDPGSTATAAYTWDSIVAEATYTNAAWLTRNFVAKTQEMSVWGADVLVDRDVLYQNFGYLLGFRKSSSEQYRAFLKGVSQLYLLGPNAERFESALNVLAGYPVVREDGETVTGFDSGVEGSGTGTIYGFAEGRGGVTVASTSRFSSSSASFSPGDVGAVLSLRNGGVSTRYAVTGFVSATTVTLSPTPPDATGVEWSYQHGAARNRFVATTPAFTSDAVGSTLVFASSRHARNKGAFRITSVEGPNVVVLESEFGFADEVGVAWQLTRTREIRVVTNKRVYTLPFGTPMRSDITSGDTVSLNAYDALTEAFTVVSEQIDPTWWHRAYIPPAVLEDAEPSRRYVSPLLVEHTFGAVDTPYYGDPDFYFGLDDEGQPPAPRDGPGVWLGGQWMTAPEAVTARDVGRYITVHTAPFRGSFKIESVDADNVSMQLERFPPPEADRETAPATVDISLPAIMFRRPVAFVMMDRILKRHAIAVRVHQDARVTPEFMADAAQLVREVRPSHAYVYMEAMSKMVDNVSLSETFGATIVAGLVDTIPVVDTRLWWRADAFIHYGDAYTYVEDTTSITYAGGAYTAMITPSAPYSAPFRSIFLSARFVGATVTVDGHTRGLAEGADYTFDKTTGSLVITRGNAGTIQLKTLTCFVRTREPEDALLDYETRVSFGGNDPSVNAPGISDRAISIRLS